MRALRFNPCPNEDAHLVTLIADYPQVGVALTGTNVLFLIRTYQKQLCRFCGAAFEIVKLIGFGTNPAPVYVLIFFSVLVTFGPVIEPFVPRSP